MTSQSPILSIKNLKASIEGKIIIDGFNLTVNPGEIHAIMGPNGAGKSTIAKVLAGHPDYQVEADEISLAGESLLSLAPEERAQRGLFMSFQYPVEIPGVSNQQFLKLAVNSKRKAQGLPELTQQEFSILLDHKMQELEMRPEFKERFLNAGFSGGEKKRNEVLQMALLEPRCAILDETDSGLDIDAVRIVARGVNRYFHSGMGLILITHYQRLLDYIRPDYVHVCMQGKIVQTGGPELALALEERGYENTH